MILQLILPLYAASVVAALLVHRARIRRRIGRNPIVIRPFSDRDAPHRHLELVLLIGVLVTLTDIALNALAADWVGEHLGIPVLQRSSRLRLVGFVAVTLGLVVTGRAVRQMGDSWRMGIDTEGPGALATRGLYNRIRHPIYTGMLMATAGMATTADVLSLGVAVGCWIALPIQARLEEQFLLARHGEDYRDYLQRTGRFWPATRS